MKRLKQDYPSKDFCFVLGADLIDSLKAWQIATLTPTLTLALTPTPTPTLIPTPTPTPTLIPTPTLTLAPFWWIL